MDSATIGYIHPGQVDEAWSHCKDAVILRSKAYIKGILSSTSARINRARNGLIETFLESDVEWLWLVDTDMTFEPDTLDRLMESADKETRPVMGGLAFIYNPFNEPTLAPSMFVSKEAGQHFDLVMRYPKDQVVEVVGTGLACLLVHRSVFEAIQKNHDDKAYVWFDETHIGPELHSDVIGPDLTFCNRVREAGFKIHIDTAVKLGHIKSMLLGEEQFEAYIGRSADEGVEDIEWRV